MTEAYAPKNPIATYIDKYGDEQIIHAPKGKGLRRYKGAGTTTLALNRAVAKLMGAKIKARRLELGMSQRDLCERAGFIDVSPKQRIHAIETATRGEGVRLGTLFALAAALDTEAAALLPTVDEAKRAAGVTSRAIVTVGLAT